jgi:hypothetical protein
MYYPSDVSVASDGTIYVLDPIMDEFKMGTGCYVGTTVTNVSGISRFSVDIWEIFMGLIL